MRRITGQWPANDPDELVTSPHGLGPGRSPGPALQQSNREGLCRLDSRFNLFNAKRRPREMGCEELESFLNPLAARYLSASSQSQGARETTVWPRTEG
jgi:hypothetical protein